MKEFVLAKDPLGAASSRWNNWFESVKYHAVHLYRVFGGGKVIIPGSHEHPQPAGNREGCCIVAYILALLFFHL
jgi:hypothetical protein